MAFDSAQSVRQDGSWGTITTLVAADGSAGHRVPQTLCRPHASARDQADAVHALCMLHGRHPGAVDHALAHNSDSTTNAWLTEAAEGFAIERAYLAQLTAAAGPLPSTPGQAESDSAVVAQAHALDMLAQSDRTGCAIGASIALLLDWRAVRAMLDAAAARFGVEIPALALPIDADTGTLASALAETPAVERAMAFGAQQVLAQHRGLWDLLEARSEARDAL